MIIFRKKTNFDYIYNDNFRDMTLRVMKFARFLIQEIRKSSWNSTLYDSKMIILLSGMILSSIYSFIILATGIPVAEMIS